MRGIIIYGTCCTDKMVFFIATVQSAVLLEKRKTVEFNTDTDLAFPGKVVTPKVYVLYGVIKKKHALLCVITLKVNYHALLREFDQRRSIHNRRSK